MSAETHQRTTSTSSSSSSNGVTHPGLEGLPSGFVAAARTMEQAYVVGTDEESAAAALELEHQLRSLTGTPHYDRATAALALMAQTASTARAVNRIREQLADATEVGRRQLDLGTEVRTLALGDGSEIAVVIPTGSDPRSRTAREALLSGTCTQCGAPLRENFEVDHDPSCAGAPARARHLARPGARKRRR